MEEELAINDRYMHKRPGSENWHFCKRIPQDILAHFKKTSKGPFIKKSLGTPDKQQARAKLKIELGKLEADFEAIRRSLKKTIEKVARPQERQLEDLTSVERNNIVLQWLQEQDQKESEGDNALLVIGDKGEIKETIENLMAEQAYFTQELEQREFAAGQSTARKILEENGIGQGKDKVAFQTLARLFSMAHHELLARSVKRLQPTTDISLQDPFFQRFYNVLNAQAPSSVTFGEVCEEYKKEAVKKMKQPLSAKAMETEIALLQQILQPSIPIKNLDRKACREAYEIISQLPKNVTNTYKGIPIRYAIEQAKEDKSPLLSPKRMNTYLDRLKAIFEYAVNEHYIIRTPMAGLTIIDDREDEDLRDPFTLQQLEKIFSAPLYTGCKDDGHGYMKPGEQFPRRARFWVPVIALWSGMRLEEICQLYVADIAIVDNIPVIQVQESVIAGEQSIKTASSQRIVPIHPELIKIGFLKYVETMQTNNHKNLFPELKRGANGKLGHPMSKWFRRFLENLKVKTEKTNFHSFRHTLAGGLKACNTPEPIANYLCGWKDTSMYGRYSKGETVPVVYDYLKQVHYPGLDLSHLYLKAK